MRFKYKYTDEFFLVQEIWVILSFSEIFKPLIERFVCLYNLGRIQRDLGTSALLLWCKFSSDFSSAAQWPCASTHTITFVGKKSMDLAQLAFTNHTFSKFSLSAIMRSLESNISLHSIPSFRRCSSYTHSLSQTLEIGKTMYFWWANPINLGLPLDIGYILFLSDDF